MDADLPPSLGPERIALQDSCVLRIDVKETSVCFTIDAALERDHPAFYWPPKTGEANAYALLKWCLHGGVHWIEGPLAPMASDATGERDFGNIDEWWVEEPSTVYVIGEFGRLAVQNAHSTFEYVANERD